MLGCGHIAEEASDCADQPDPAACVAAVQVDWATRAYQAHAPAWQRLQRRCDLGDADACARVPGRAIPPAELCAAGDYYVCAELGCAGDAAAAEAGRAGGEDLACAP